MSRSDLFTNNKCLLVGKPQSRINVLPPQIFMEKFLAYRCEPQVTAQSPGGIGDGKAKEYTCGPYANHGCLHSPG